MLKKWGIVFLIIFAALVTSCSNEETTVKENKKTTSTEKKSEQETSSEDMDKEKESENEELEEKNLVEPITVNKRNATLFENEYGKVILVGETITSESKILMALKAEKELKNINLDDVEFRLITDAGNDENLDAFHLIGRRFQGDSTFFIYESSNEVDAQKIMRIDYSFKVDSNRQPVDVKNLVLEETSDSVEIPALKKITETVYDNLNIVKENEKFKITINSIDMNSEDFKSVSLIGKIESKQDMKLEDEFFYKRADNTSSSELSVDVKQSELFASVPVDVTFTAQTDFPFGKDKSSIINFSLGNLFFSFDLTTGKEYRGPFSLTDIPTNDEKWSIEPITIDGYTDVEGKKYYTGIQSSNGNWNWGISDPSERATAEYLLGKKFKTLKFKIGAGELYKDKSGTYDIMILGDDFQINSEQEYPSGKILMHEKIASNSPMKEVVVDVSDVEKLRLYFQTNDQLIQDEDKKKGKVQLILTDITLD